MKKSRKKMTALSSQSNVEAFSFGEPIPVLDRAEILNYFEPVLMYQKYYNPPINLSYLAKAINASSHHQSAITVKKNILLSTCKTTALLPRTQLEKLVQDYLVFGNAYVEIKRNSFGEVIALNAPLAKYMRVGVEQGVFYQVVNGFDEHKFAKGSVFNLVNPDVNQEIYGVPEYLAALQSAFLNESATLFRRKYYLNGAHAGAIIYMTDPTQNKDSVEAIKEQIRQTKGTGNFKNLFINIPDGKKDGIQVIPLSDAVAKDEFLNIKNTSRDDVLAAHRVPPQLMGIIPNNTGGFGDVEKATKVFFVNEIIPLQERLKEINAIVGKEVITFSEYKLFE
ncbi:MULTISPECIES: phage portal protein [Rodentibacter]|uniref:Phage portal protein n=1 Tax=Rodentibacter pneumotropicus TaxID=758 RepID=A0A4S2QLI9_9PAST|nr:MULTISPECIES: phage portal protein [Pasteurellaceae]TGY50839.1 phage portal protein [Pasteurella caecimuris]TGZ98536.1 phage portal protein [Rodentibacter pneumotropicus]THA00932.1 phage portal protein [Rodentibacter pneumotropicus]THA05091.1 phage portal protein [Rodentibacter pneumotropicus]THA08208.1 phage portal protein [Rodentibacter pneumotropicus]